MKGEDLSLDNILTGDDFEHLFDDETTGGEEETPTDKEKENIEDKDKDTTEVDFENLFEEPESVGGEEKQKEKEDTAPPEDGTSPNFYSSIANALREDGIFPDLEDSKVTEVTSAEDFAALIEEQIKASLNERQKRIDEALTLGVEPTVIQQYENVINNLNNIKESSIEDEGEEGENLRKKLILQDFLNRGFSKERANRELDKSFRAGTDIEDAKEALKSNMEFFQNSYDKLIQDAKDEEEKAIKERQKQSETLKKSILEEKKVFGDLEVDKTTRQKVYENISKPVYKDPETGEFLTAIQKYELENKTEFLKNIGLFFTLTNGFKDLDRLIKDKVKKEKKSAIAELEHTLNNTSRTSGGNIRFAGGNDKESSFRGYTIDI